MSLRFGTQTVYGIVAFATDGRVEICRGIWGSGDKVAVYSAVGTARSVLSAESKKARGDIIALGIAESDPYAKLGWRILPGDLRAVPRKTGDRLLTPGPWAAEVLEAFDTDTSPERLATLAANELFVVRASVAANPNTPAARVAELVFDDEDKVSFAAIGNPAVPVEVLALIVVTDPNPQSQRRRRTDKALDQRREA